MFEFASYNENQEFPDTSETIQISALALLKMLKHARSGVPMEVMGLMLGEHLDEYTVRVIDVFAMPQTGTGVTVEAVDPVYQTKMMDILKLTGRKESVVGWYHSHPGFGCWLSSVDIQTQQSFEQLDKRAVAVVVDPIQSVKGKVVIDAFRIISNQPHMFSSEPRQVTSNIGYLNKPTLVSILHGLNRQYYSFNISYKKHELEQQMLLSLHKKTWADNLRMRKVENEPLRKEILHLTKNYIKMVNEEKKLSEKDLEIYKIGRVDYRKHLLDKVSDLYDTNSHYAMLYSIHKRVFK